MTYKGKKYSMIAIPTKLDDKVVRVNKAVERRKQSLHHNINNAIKRHIFVKYS